MSDLKAAEAVLQARYVGKAILRKEDERFLTGRASFVADVQLPGMVHAAICRSPHASARLRRLDISKALRLPGVYAVVTHKDLPSDIRIPVRLGPKPPRVMAVLQPLLAGEVVRYVGEPMAVVVAKALPALLPLLSGGAVQFYALLAAYVVLVLGCIMRGL